MVAGPRAGHIPRFRSRCEEPPPSRGGNRLKRVMAQHGNQHHGSPVQSIIVANPAGLSVSISNVVCTDARSRSFADAAQVMRSKVQRAPLAAASLPSPVISGPSRRSASATYAAS